MLKNNLDPTYERSLIEQARHQRAAFQELYRHYFPRIYAYVAYRVASVQDAEDIVSTIFLKVIQELDRFVYQDHGSFAAWMFRIAHHQVVDFYRRRGVAEVVPLDALPDLQSSALPPDDDIVRQESFANLRRLIATLSPRRQEVITLKFFGGLRNKDIAAILGLDERSVAAHLCRGLEDLHRKHLEDSRRVYDEDAR